MINGSKQMPIFCVKGFVSLKALSQGVLKNLLVDLVHLYPGVWCGVRPVFMRVNPQSDRPSHSLQNQSSKI